MPSPSNPDPSNIRRTIVEEVVVCRREDLMEWHKNQFLGGVAAVALIVGLLLSGQCGWADQHFSQEVFFENSLASGSYPYSRGNVSAPSTLRLVDGKLPVDGGVC